MRLDKPLRLDFEANQSPLQLEGVSEPYSRKLLALVNVLAELMVAEGRSLTMDGVKVFEAQDPFLSGKIAMALAYWIGEYSSSSAVTVARCKNFRCLTELTIDDPCESWGAHFYLKALTKLSAGGLLDACVGPDLMQRLCVRLDWRSFVDEVTYELKGKPHNYYGVAYSIAYSRFLLGWDDVAHSEAMLERLLEHYRSQKGEYVFPDETNGQGRYDRYSFLLIAEVAEHFRNASKPLTLEMELALRKSAEYVLFNLNYDGEGFQYGRSIGAYGDASYLEILASAAWFGLLNKTEIQDGFLFSKLITDRFLHFWYDKARGSVNLWDDGRETESYRGKHRILGETLTLAIQHLAGHSLWEKIKEREGDSVEWEAEVFSHQIEHLYSHKLTWFHADVYEYALLSVRRGLKLFNLPLVNADSFHTSLAYSPAPFSSDLVVASPRDGLMQLTPRFEHVDGRVLVPISWYQDINLVETQSCVSVSWATKTLTELRKGKSPNKIEGIRCKSKIDFYVDRIERNDEIVLDPPGILAKVAISYFSTRKGTKEGADLMVSEEHGGPTFKVWGFDLAEVLSIEKIGATSSAYQSEVRAEKHVNSSETKIQLGWTLKF